MFYPSSVFPSLKPSLTVLALLAVMQRAFEALRHSVLNSKAAARFDAREMIQFVAARRRALHELWVLILQSARTAGPRRPLATQLSVLCFHLKLTSGGLSSKSKNSCSWMTRFFFFFPDVG